jgi:O-antigen ligase
VALSALRDTGLFGFGPGTFRVIFPAYNQAVNNLAPGTWRFLHEDYLQIAMEWGWLGSALWAALFVGGIIFALVNLRKPEARTWSWRRRLILPLAVIALAGVALHAAVDFPLQIASIQLYVATYLGLCWGSARWRSVR